MGQLSSCRWWSIIFRKSMLTSTNAWKLCLISSVFSHETLFNFNNTQNPASIQNLLNLSCCESLSIRSSQCCHPKFWFVVPTFSKEISVLISLCTINWLSHQCTTLPWSTVKRFMFFTHFRDCSVKTELIYRNNYAQNSLNCFLVCKMNGQFFVSFRSWIDFCKMGSQHGRTSAFCEFQQHLSEMSSQVDNPPPWNATSFRNQHQLMPLCLVPHIHTKIRLHRVLDILLHCLSFQKKCRWTSTKIECFLRNFLVWLFHRAATCPILGKCSTRIHSALHCSRQSLCNFLRRCDPFHPFLPSFVGFQILMHPLTTQYRILSVLRSLGVEKLVMILHSWEDQTFSSSNFCWKESVALIHLLQQSESVWRRSSYVEDWWFFHHQLMTEISMNVFPNKSFPMLRSHHVLSLISQICRTWFYRQF